MVFQKSLIENLRKNTVLNILHLLPLSHSQPLSASPFVPKGSTLHPQLLKVFLAPGFQLVLATGTHRQEVGG